MGSGKTFEQEPSWIIVIMLLAFLIISIATEHLFEHFDHKFRNKEGYRDVMKKIKDELMLMGFISLLLVVFQDNLTSACMSKNLDVGVPEDICIVRYPESYSSSAGSSASSAASTAAASTAAASSSAASSAASAASSSGTRRMLLNAFRTDTNTTTNYVGSRHLLSSGGVALCGENETTLLDAAAVHHVHILIFVIACTHIAYSLILIQMSESMIRRWTNWELWGDDEGETLERLVVPSKFKNGCHAACSGLIGQFASPVSPMKYISLRRFYLAKNKHPAKFNFANHLIEGLEKDFHELVGISWWMWFILMCQVLAEGYGFGQYNLFALLSLMQTIGVGMYCSAVISNLTQQIYTSYGGTNYGGICKQEILDKMQSRATKHHGILKNVEPSMLCLKNFSTLKLNIRFVMFQNSTSLAQALFFAWQIGSNACYFDIRNDIMYTINLILNVIMLFHNSLVTVPLYSIVAHLDYHSNPPKPPSGHGHDGGGDGEHGDNKVHPVVAAPATSVDTTALLALNDLFHKFDANDDGNIEADEFRQLTEQMQNKHDEEKKGDFAAGPISGRDCDSIFNALDTDENGGLSRDEFVHWVASGLTKTEHECEMFASSGVLQLKLMNFLTLIREEIICIQASSNM